MPTRLSNEDFLHVVKHAPLVAIDLIIHNTKGEFLLGSRKNAPAQGSWYFLGGRVFKDETIEAALGRIATAECFRPGVSLDLTREFVGVCEYFFDTNFDNAPGVRTHYVTLNFRIVIPDTSIVSMAPDDQHHAKGWFSVENLMLCDKVHEDVKKGVSTYLSKVLTGRLPH